MCDGEQFSINPLPMPAHYPVGHSSLWLHGDKVALELHFCQWPRLYLRYCFGLAYTQNIVPPILGGYWEQSGEKQVVTEAGECNV